MVDYGYSHAIFRSSSMFREHVLYCDDKKNGGNDNGLLDGDEIKKFKSIVQSKYNHIFNFENIEKVKVKKVKVRDAETREPIFGTGKNIADEYGGATTTKTIDWLNDKQPGIDLIKYATIELDIPYMDNYKSSVEEVNKQEKEIIEAREKERQEKEELDEKYQEKHWFRYAIGISREKFEEKNERDY